jgi:uncharacterized protein YggE
MNHHRSTPTIPTIPTAPTNATHRGSRRLGVLALGAVIAAGAVACSADAQTPGTTPPINVAAPQVNVGSLAAGITVTGEGEVTGTPDTLSVSFGVTTKRDTVDAAVGDNATSSAKVLETLKAGGVAEKDIQTQNYSLQPSFAYAEGRQVPDGYTVNNTVSVKLHDLKGAGGVIDAVTKAGGTDVGVQGVSFTLEDNKALLTTARDKAFADAKAKAEQLSTLSGRKIGVTEAVGEEVRPTSYPIAMAQTAAGDSARSATALQPGEVKTNVTLTVRFTFA